MQQAVVNYILFFYPVNRQSRSVFCLKVRKKKCSRNIINYVPIKKKSTKTLKPNLKRNEYWFLQF